MGQVAKDRKSARATGAKKYYHCRPCRKDGCFVRWTANGSCVECGRTARMKHDAARMEKLTVVSAKVKRKHVKMLRNIALTWRRQCGL